MKQISQTLGLMALLLAGCTTPLETYYRPGAAVTQVSRDTTACEVNALRQVPSSIQSRRLPPRFVPPRQVCDGAGACHVVPGFYVPGEILTFDPNDELRQRVEGQCMADRGYRPVSIPQCPDGVAGAAPARATQRLPTLTAQSCVIYNDDGSYQIVTLG